MKKISILLLSVFILNTANSQTPVLYKDINNLINTGSIFGNPEYTKVGNKVFFVADAPATGKELYVSDGTPGGTKVIDLFPGTSSSSPTYLTEMNGVLYFSASDTYYTRELWKSDGTTEGTMMVKDMEPGLTIGSSPTLITNVNGTLYFVAYDITAGRELWKSNLTKAGTSLVKDIKTGIANTDISNITGVGNNIFFTANDGTHGIELWMSDGTDAGTNMVKDIRTGSASSSPFYLTNLNGVLYFKADDGNTGVELWKSNGTTEGTEQVKDIWDGPKSSEPGELYAFKDNLYFRADDGTNNSLWKTDGTNAGTSMLMKGYASNFLAIGNTLFFSSNDAANGSELWKTDGSIAGTELVKDMNPGINPSSPTNFINFNGTLFFRTLSPAHALWKSDGTGLGTVKVGDATVGGGIISNLYAGVNKIHFVYSGYKEGIPSTATGTEPWVSDGTDANTILLKDINTRNSHSYPFNFCKIGNTIFFTADDGIAGKELWKTDGTAAGTVMVRDITPGPVGTTLANLTAVNNTLFFTATITGLGNELWKSDGTADGTKMVKDIYPGASGSSPLNLTEVNGSLYFSAITQTNGRELWKSDGTEVGTVMVKDIVPGGNNSNPQKFTYANGTIFFTAQNGVTGGFNGDEELWKTDGTEAGTAKLKDIYPGVGSSYPTGLINFKNRLYFAANDPINGGQLWISDGSGAGTKMFKEFSQGESIRLPANFKVIGDIMYFAAEGLQGGAVIYKSDGTATGTVEIKKVSTSSSYKPAGFTLSNGLIFFTAVADGKGAELWKTNGTKEGTELVKDIRSGISGSDVEFLTDFKGTLYFKAKEDIINKSELWKSDGTEEGTISLNLNPDAESDPFELTVLNDRLIFAAMDFYKGRELWRIENFALPLNLLDFTARKDNNKVELSWQTTNEVNTSVFEIERTGESGFVKIGEVAAMNRAGDHRYSSYDEQPLKGTNLYRLKMIDLDGKFTYSNIERVDFNIIEQVRISPNPASNELKISNVKGYEMLQVMDASGRIVHQQKISGDQELVNIQKLLPGNYVVRLTGKVQKSIQFVKK